MRPAVEFTMPVGKQTHNLDWEDLRYFLALTRHRSLSATARGLRVTHATVSRRVTSLEALLGRPLFERRADGYALTPHGQALLDEADAMEQAALAVLRRFDTGSELNGLVRLTAARTLADSFLVDHLGELHGRYPGLELELISDARVASLARREADIALRLGASKDSDLVARRLGTIAFGLYASPAYCEKAACGKLHEVIGYDVIGYDRDSDFIFGALWLTHQFPDGRFTFRSNSPMSQAAAARAGYGIALLPQFLAANDAGLVPVQFEESLPNCDIWLLFHRDLGKAPLVRAVADYLIDTFRHERHVLANGAAFGERPAQDARPTAAEIRIHPR